jgi:WD40 repeat protein
MYPARVIAAVVVSLLVQPPSWSFAQSRTPAAAPRSSKAIASRWQAVTDPVSADDFSPQSIGDVDITLPDPFGELFVPCSPSHFAGYVVRRSKTSLTSWDLRSGERLGSLMLDRQIVLPPALAPDGGAVAIAHVGKQPKIEIWSLITSQLSREIALDEALPTVQLLLFAGRDRLIVQTAGGQGARIFDALAGNEIDKLPMTTARDAQPAISPGGRYAAVAGSHSLQIYDLRNGSLTSELAWPSLPGPNSAIRAIQFSPDGGELAALSASEAPQLLCWSLYTGKLILQHDLTLSKKLMSAGSSHEGRPIDFIPGNKGWLLFGQAILGRDGSGPVSLFPVARPETRGPRIMLDEDRFLTIQGDYQRRRLTIARLPWDDFNKQTALATLGAGADDISLPPLTAPDRASSREVASRVEALNWNVPIDAGEASPLMINGGIDVPLSALDSGTLLLSGPQDSRAVIPTSAVQQPSAPATPVMELMRFSLVSGNRDGLASPTFPFEVLDLSRNGRQILLATAQRERLDVLDAETGMHVVGFRPYHASPVAERRINSALLLPGEHLLTQNTRGQIECWSLPTCKSIYSLKGSPAGQLILSPSRKYLLANFGDRYWLVHAMSGDVAGVLQRPLVANGAELRAGAFRGDGKRLAALFVVESEHRLVLWNLENGKVLSHFTIAPSIALTWLSESHLLGHVPTEIGSPTRFRLIDVSRGHTVWEYRLPRGALSRQPLGGKVWFLAYDDQTGTADLVGHTLPSPETLAAIEGAPAPKNLMARGSTIGLKLDCRGIDAKPGEPARIAEIQKLIASRLASRGVRMKTDARYAFSVSLEERLTGDLIEVNVASAGKNRVEIPEVELHCLVKLASGESPPVWSSDRTFTMRSDMLQRGKTIAGTPLDWARRQLAEEALDWLTKEAIPVQVYPDWAQTGIGTSVLGPSGESQLQLKELDGD